MDKMIRTLEYNEHVELGEDQDGNKSCWIRGDLYTVYVTEWDDRILVDICEAGREAQTAIASCQVLFANL